MAGPKSAKTILERIELKELMFQLLFSVSTNNVFFILLLFL